MEDPLIQFVVRRNGVETLLSAQEAKLLLDAEVPGVKPALFGSPRTKEGDSEEGLEVFSSPLFAYLLLEVSENPDAFMPKGTNFSYKVLPGRKKRTGADTDWYGNVPPAGFVKPPGYRKRYIRDKKTGLPLSDQIYYELSNEPDEVLEQTKPTGNTSTNSTAKPQSPLDEMEEINDYLIDYNGRVF